MVKVHILGPNYQSPAEFQVYFMLQAGYLGLRTPLFDFGKEQRVQCLAQARQDT